MGSIHSQLLPSPKSVSGWGSAQDPPSPIARGGRAPLRLPVWHAEGRGANSHLRPGRQKPSIRHCSLQMINSSKKLRPIIIMSSISSYLKKNRSITIFVRENMILYYHLRMIETSSIEFFLSNYLFFSIFYYPNRQTIPLTCIFCCFVLPFI